MKVEFIKAPVQGQSETGTIMLIVGIKMRNLLLLYDKVKIKLRKMKKIKSLLFHFYSFLGVKQSSGSLQRKCKVVLHCVFSL